MVIYYLVRISLLLKLLIVQGKSLIPRTMDKQNSVIKIIEEIGGSHCISLITNIKCVDTKHL